MFLGAESLGERGDGEGWIRASLSPPSIPSPCAGAPPCLLLFFIFSYGCSLCSCICSLFLLSSLFFLNQHCPRDRRWSRTRFLHFAASFLPLCSEKTVYAAVLLKRCCHVSVAILLTFPLESLSGRVLRLFSVCERSCSQKRYFSLRAWTPRSEVRVAGGRSERPPLPPPPPPPPRRSTSLLRFSFACHVLSGARDRRMPRP